jgi:hypothetical protein
MPYQSRAQQGLFHSPNSPVSAKVVAEFDAASKGQKGLPYKKKPGPGLAKAFAKGKISGKVAKKAGYDVE